MNRIVIAAAATIALVPAAIGFAGTSFAQGLTGHSTTVTDDKGGMTRHAEPADDRSTDATPTATPSTGPTTDDKGGLTEHAEPGDDKGGLTEHAEPGDDNGGSRTSATRTSDDGTHHSSSHSTHHSSSTATPAPSSSTDDHGRSTGHGSDDGSGHK